MANTWAVKMASGFGFKPGQKAFWIWNNAPSNTVFSFSVQPYVLAGAEGKAAVTNVNYYIHGNPQEREVHVEITNTGNSTVNYDLFMGQISI